MEFIDDLKIVWNFLAKYKRKVYIIFVVAVFASAIEAMVPYFYGKIIDLIIINKQISEIFLILIFWLGLSLIKDWGHRYVGREGEIISVKCANDLVIDFNRHVLHLGLSFHKSQKTGKLASKYIKASDYLQGIINEILFIFGSDLLTVFFAYLVILSIVILQLRI
jgi:ABC-type multidrug transport system fused ATPase/permease subunit